MTDFKDDKSKAASGGKSFKDQILNELEEANRLKGIQDDGTIKSIVDNLDTTSKREIDSDFNWQEAAAKLKEQQEAAAKSAEKEQERALKEAQAIKKIQEEEHLRELNSFGEELEEAEPSEESSAYSSPIPTMASETLAPEISDVDLSGFTIPIPIQDIHSASPESFSSEGSETDQVSEPEEPSFDLHEDLAEAEEFSDLDSDLDDKDDPDWEQDDDEDEEEETKSSRRKAKQRKQKQKKKKRLARRITGWIISLILIAILAGGGYGYYYVNSSLAPLDSKSQKYVTVEIPEGAGSKQIGQILQKKGLIKDATVFNYYTKFKNYSDLKSGYYNLKASMSTDEIIKELQAGGTAQPTEPSSGKIVIPEGYTLEQIAKAIEDNANTKVKGDKTPYSSKNFLKLMKDKDFIKKMKEKYPKLLADLPDSNKAKYQLEGYLFPATYDYTKDTSLEDLADQMLGTMDSYLSQYYDKISQSKYNINVILALASLVEKEGQADEDRAKIASVFYNRLDADMPLQSNIAVLYALGKLGQKTTLEEDANIDTDVDSPYNDYKNKGLMPGPVDSPSLSAIEAVVNPADTKYLYFVADVETGKVYYSETYEEHEKNVETYVNKKTSDSSEKK
ncbi:endolytic transglycosylase MltG [Streptococcus downei]|uniref:Endolytic murein transglycosylase n=1 Tax=Streptococcus downei MFe28 TaxID=764290 RepID=A0A380JEP2_STRDO|nr:endolytic transglycosylase MltG [Streptococcus downei]SUN35877.1 YceG-like family membrane protein [Streptococcus downei MFe28]